MSDQNIPHVPPRFSRPSYANVARGHTASAQHFNTLAAAGIHSSLTTSSLPPQQQRQEPEQVARHRSRSSLRSIDMEGQGGGGGSGSAAGAPLKRPGSAWSNDLNSRLEGRMGCIHHEHHPPFFTPSYLRHSRYVERLKVQWEEHLAELRKALQLSQPPMQPSLSTSSSSANLSKMHTQHVHRAPVQDVIERLPPQTEDDKIRPLPSRWSDEEHINGLEVLADGSEMRFNGMTKTSDEAASVRSDYPMPKEAGLFYYEVTILGRSKEGLIGIGFSSRKVNLNRLPGWEANSWAYHGDDGFSFACTASGKAYGPKYSSHDVIGCGVNFRTGQAFFTKNGVNLGVAFKDINTDSTKLYPSVGVKRPGEHLRVNFGRHRFVFDIDGYMAAERSTVQRDVLKADLSALHPPDDERALIHNLIGQYLAHEGYVETVKAFSKDVHEQQQSLSTEPQPFQPPDSDDDIHAFNRQKIRRAILDGEIDQALKYMSAFYPHVLEEERNRDVDFRLKCRKFVEMMRKCYELSAATTSPTTVTKSVASLDSNGHISDPEEDDQDPPDTQMELDDQLHREASKGLDPSGNDDVDMDASQEMPPKASFMRHQDLLNDAFRYGAELRAEYIGDARPAVQKQLLDVFGLMAYQNPADSGLGALLDPRGREEIAESVNGAILVSLGKPPFAALEKLCTTTEALLDATTAKAGGAAAFVNVREDFLRP